MSEAPCKIFSAALNTAVSELMHREEPGPQIPVQVMNLQKSLMNTSTWPEGVGNDGYGLMDSSSQLIRRISDTKYEFHFKLVLPFKLTPIRDQVRPGFVMLQANADVLHPAVVNGFLDRIALANWLPTIFQRRSFYNFNDFRRTFTVKLNLVQIKVVCLPVLEFEHSQWPLPSPELSTSDLILRAHPWYAVPLASRPLDSRAFAVWAPDWERCLMDNHHHSRRLLRLMAALASGTEDYYKIVDFDQVIRTVLLQELPNLPRDLGNAMIAFLTALVARLQEGRLSRFLVANINVLHFHHDEILEVCHEFLSEALQKLKFFKLSAQNEEYNVNPDILDADQIAFQIKLNRVFQERTGENVPELEESWKTEMLKMFDIGLD